MKGSLTTSAAEEFAGNGWQIEDENGEDGKDRKRGSTFKERWRMEISIWGTVEVRENE